MLRTIYAVLAQTLLIGHDAAKLFHALRVMVIVIVMRNVKARSFVALITVEVDHQTWTVV